MHRTSGNESRLVKEKLDALNRAFELISVLGAERRKYLEDHRDLHRFVEEADEEWMWLQEKLQVVKSTETGSSLSATQILINKHEQLEDELKFRKPRVDDKIVRRGEELIASARFAHAENDRLAAKCLGLLKAFESLRHALAHPSLCLGRVCKVLLRRKRVLQLASAHGRLRAQAFEGL